MNDWIRLHAIAVLWNLKLNRAKDFKFALEIYRKFELLNYFKN